MASIDSTPGRIACHFFLFLLLCGSIICIIIGTDFILTNNNFRTSTSGVVQSFPAPVITQNRNGTYNCRVWILYSVFAELPRIGVLTYSNNATPLDAGARVTLFYNYLSPGMISTTQGSTKGGGPLLVGIGCASLLIVVFLSFSVYGDFSRGSGVSDSFFLWLVLFEIFSR
jgi:hypothetical protein